MIVSRNIDLIFGNFISIKFFASILIFDYDSVKNIWYKNEINNICQIYKLFLLILIFQNK